MRRKLLVLLAVFALVPVGAASLAACGKKASLDPPPGSTYPKKYPTQ